MCLDDHQPPKRQELAALAAACLQQLEREGIAASPVVASGRNLAKSFWAREWMKRLADQEIYGMRLAPGRAYLRYECVLNLDITAGHVHALVAGEDLYEVDITVETPDEERIALIRERNGGDISSWVDLLKGNLSEDVLNVLCREGAGIMPEFGTLSCSCTCPDWADLCAHSAAALYAVGVRLDTKPELLFVLRNITPEQLVPRGHDESGHQESPAPGNLFSLFGINLEE